MRSKIIVLTLLMLSGGFAVHAQMVAAKTNMLYGVGTLTPNLGVEIGLNEKSSLDLSAGLNLWNLDEEKKWIHFLFQPEYRYWTCEKFNGHFYGIHGIFARYNVGGIKIPTLFEKDLRYEGYAYGGGISYGYHWMLSPAFGVEFNIGVGVAYLTYDSFNCMKCGDLQENASKFYFGPTKAGISLTYIIK